MDRGKRDQRQDCSVVTIQGELSGTASPTTVVDTAAVWMVHSLKEKVCQATLFCYRRVVFD